MSQGASLHIQSEIFPEAVVVRLKDARLTDTGLIETLGQEMNDLIDRTGQVRLVISFDKVQTMGSYFIAKLLNLQERLHNEHGKLKLSNLNTSVQDILRVCGVTKKFAIYRDEQAALDAF